MIKSMLDPKKAGQMANISTQPKERGPSPNITTLIEFKLPLPVEKLYCPSLSATVFDNVFMGFSQPKVGSFTIPVGDIMHEKLKRRKDTVRMAQGIAEHLEKILEGQDSAQVKNDFLRFRSEIDGAFVREEEEKV